MNSEFDNFELIRYALKKVPPPVKTHGGKAYLARRLLQLMPVRKMFLEPFAGGASVLLNIVPNLFARRSLNDRNPKLIARYDALQNQPDAFLPLSACLTTAKTFSSPPRRGMKPALPWRA
jgi:site-specific DNA-adenine methylase